MSITRSLTTQELFNWYREVYGSSSVGLQPDKMHLDFSTVRVRGKSLAFSYLYGGAYPECISIAYEPAQPEVKFYPPKNTAKPSPLLMKLCQNLSKT